MSRVNDVLWFGRWHCPTAKGNGHGQVIFRSIIPINIQKYVAQIHCKIKGNILNSPSCETQLGFKSLICAIELNQSDQTDYCLSCPGRHNENRPITFEIPWPTRCGAGSSSRVSRAGDKAARDAGTRYLDPFPRHTMLKLLSLLQNPVFSFEVFILYKDR